MKFKDIKKLTSYGNYRVSMSLVYFVEWIKTHVEEKVLSPLQLMPDFQRCHVWSDEQRSKYIEYLLRGGKSGHELYFNHTGWNKDYNGEFVLVDGLQRITAIQKFLNNEIKIFGKYFYKDFEDKISSDIDVFVNINNLQTRKDVIRWYIEMNEGHIAHTKEEIQKAKILLEKEIEKEK